MIELIFMLTAETIISTGTKTNEANAEIETEPITVEVRKRKCST